MGDFNIFDILIALSGAYLIYTAVIMKTSGKLAAGVLVSKDVNVKKIRDKEGFIKYMFMKVLLLGVFACLVGVMGMVCTKLQKPPYITLIGIVCYLVLLILFAVASNRAKKLYIDPE